MAAFRILKVRVYHAAIAALADSLPVREAMDRMAESVREKALENARVIIPGLPDSFLRVETGRDTRGLFFRVGPDGGGKISEYLSAKERREHVWLEPAVSEVAGFGSVKTFV